MRPLTWLIGGTLLAWLILAWPAHEIAGEMAFRQSGLAMLLCLVPAVLTMFLARLASSRSPEYWLLLMLGGTGLRMFLVLGAVLLVRFALPHWSIWSFAMWVLVFYLGILALEVTLLVQQKLAGEKIH